MSEVVIGKQATRSADFPGDEAFMKVRDSSPPCLVVNSQADETALLSGVMHRLENASDLMWLVLDRVNDGGDKCVEGSVVTLGRLCNEARQICAVLMERLEALDKPVHEGKAGKVPK
jgi:hypothetical protein